MKDSDGDGLSDGLERGVVAPGVLGPDGQPDGAPGVGVQDGTAALPVSELDTDDSTVTDPLDGDSDEDGLSDGQEDVDGDGSVDAGESDPGNPDTDGDLLYDGLEAGLTIPQFDTDVTAGFYQADADPLTTTDPANPDTDGGGATDGEEDADLNGQVDPPERDPLNPADDDRSGILEFTDSLNGATRTTPLVVGDTIFLRLDDDTDENLDPNVAETVDASCAGTGASAETETVTLTAVDPDSGVFAGSIPTAASSGASDGTLTLDSGAGVTCTYTDAQDPVDVRTAMLAVSLTAPRPIPEIDLVMLPSGAVGWSVSGSSLAPGSLSFNLYRGSPQTLRATGVYTQVPAACALSVDTYDDGFTPAPGETVFYLTAGVADGAEGALGYDSLGRERPSTGACSP